jgi:hypothetical protein
VESWRSLVTQYAATYDVPVGAALAWIRRESGGNPCSVGAPGKEAGIFQLYFDRPGDSVHGATYDQLRSACVLSSQQTSRALTDDERARQVISGLAYMAQCRDTSLAQLAAVGAAWSTSDLWTLAKQQHNLPVIPKQRLITVTASLGRAPATWAEFADNLDPAPWMTPERWSQIRALAEDIGSHALDSSTGSQLASGLSSGSDDAVDYPSGIGGALDAFRSAYEGDTE